ncbi:MAG: hypothetical protein AAF845_12205, partial [Bacteroidota bacterium]
LDQAERGGEFSDTRINTIRQALRTAESASGSARQAALTALAADVEREARNEKMRMLAETVRSLATSA